MNFGLSVSVLLGLTLPLLVFPSETAAVLAVIYAWIANTFGWFYILTGAATLALVLYIAFSRYGVIRLGSEDPEFPTLSWVGMLFAAGIGSGMLYWSAIEWAYYVQAPPFGADPFSDEAYDWAASYGLHHWGFVAWAFYSLPTLAIAYPFYVRKVPQLKYSNSAQYWLKGRENSWPARLMDSFFMIALIGGAGSSLGISTPLISALIARLTGIPDGFALELVVVGICVALFSMSVWLGLSRGIRRLSDINLLMAFLFLLFVLFAGDTLFILRMAVNSVGHLLQNTLAMTFWTDPIANTGFVGDWTVFYWAWWIAYAPFIGIFVTRISRGRTLREVVFGMLCLGSLGVWLFFFVLGNHSLGLQLSGEVDVIGVMNAESGNAAIVAGLNALPLAAVAIGLFCVVGSHLCGDDLRQRFLHAGGNCVVGACRISGSCALAPSVLGHCHCHPANRVDVRWRRARSTNGDIGGVVTPDLHFLAYGHRPTEIVARRPPSAIKQHTLRATLPF